MFDSNVCNFYYFLNVFILLDFFLIFLDKANHLLEVIINSGSLSSII